MQLSNCQIWTRLGSIFYIFAHGSVGLLFFFRVQAVYTDNRWVAGFFAIAWLFLVATAIVGYFIPDSIHIGPSQYCITLVDRNLPLLVAASQGTYDMLICLAITYKLTGHDWTERMASLKRVFKTRQPRITSIFVQDSVIYYM